MARRTLIRRNVESGPRGRMAVSLHPPTFASGDIFRAFKGASYATVDNRGKSGTRVTEPLVTLGGGKGHPQPPVSYPFWTSMACLLPPVGMFGHPAKFGLVVVYTQAWVPTSNILYLMGGGGHSGPNVVVEWGRQP